MVRTSAVTGQINGQVMARNCAQRPAPSRAPASGNQRGILRIPARNSSTLNWIVARSRQHRHDRQKDYRHTENADGPA